MSSETQHPDGPDRAAKVRRGNADNVLDVKRTYTIYLDRSAIAEEYEQDEITLESHDGEYKQTLVLGEQGEVVGDYLKVTFTRLKPRKCYGCTLLPSELRSSPAARIEFFQYIPLEDQHFNKPEPVDEAFLEEEQNGYGDDPEWTAADGRAAVEDEEEIEPEDAEADESADDTADEEGRVVNLLQDEAQNRGTWYRLEDRDEVDGDPATGDTEADE